MDQPGTPSRLLASFAGDVRIAVRSLRRSPALALAVLLTLGLGIGASTAMVSVVRGVLLRPLPFPEPERLVRIGSAPATAEQVASLRGLASMSEVTALGADSMTLTVDGTAHSIDGLFVDGAHHRVFGVPPELGRALRPDDSLPGAEAVVVLSHELWVRFFGADEDVLGRPIRLAGAGTDSHTVVGIQGPGYGPGPWEAAFVVPHRYAEGGHDWSDMARFWAVGRLEPGTDRAAATTEARTLAMRLAEEGRAFDRASAESLSVTGLLDARVGSVRSRLWILLAAVLTLLLIGCGNLANLMLVRALGREREFVVRRALGAGRRRLIRQLLTEGAVLAAAGTVLGVALAAVALPTARSLLPEELPRSGEIALDLPVLVFSAILSVVVALVFGLAPSWRLTSSGSGGSRSSSGAVDAPQRRLQNTLLAGQIALSVALLSCCALLVQTLIHLQSVDPGLQVERIHALRLAPPSDRFPDEERRRLYFEAVEEELASLPGVESVGSITLLPLTPGRLGVGISPDGAAVPEGERPLFLNYRAISPGYLGTTGVPLLAGRNLTDSDRAGGQAVGLVNRRLAERLWPGARAVGETVHWSTGEPWFEVVGVIGDVRQASLADEVMEEVYLPYAQEAWVPSMEVLVRANGPAVTPEVLRRTVRAQDPLVPIVAQRTMAEVVGRSLAGARFNAGFFTGFALLGILLSVVGVHGLTLHMVSRRRAELGVRMALGADGARVVRHVVGGSLPPILGGVGVGVLLAIVAGRSLDSLLHGTGPWSPTVLLPAPLVLGLGALAVSALAARRAARISPGSALHAD